MQHARMDNFGCVYCLIMSSDPYFHFISGLYHSNHLKYYMSRRCVACKNKDTALLHFLIVYPGPAVKKPGPEVIKLFSCSPQLSMKV